MAVTLDTLRKLKLNGEKFATLTAYDSTFAHLVSSAGVEVILVGDSLGMVLQGNDSTLPVSMRDMAYHTACVARGNQGALLMADLPFMSYGTLPEALANAGLLMQAGAHIIKLEGGAWLAESVAQLARNGVPVCAHLGLTPQSVNVFGGYRVQGREPDKAQAIVDDARALVQAGAAMLLLECVPNAVTEAVMQAVPVPVIGIGAGPASDSQVLVLHDMLGITVGRTARFVRNFMPGNASIQEAVAAYVRDVKSGAFPAPEHCFR